jgi:hypothetical protein
VVLWLRGNAELPGRSAEDQPDGVVGDTNRRTELGQLVGEQDEITAQRFDAA